MGRLISPLLAALRLIKTMPTLRITLAAFVLLIPIYKTSALDDSSFILINTANSLCLLKKGIRCLEVRWTTDDRLFVTSTKKCLGVQGKTVGSEVNLYDCNEKSELQKWECKNNTVLALKGRQLFIESKADGSLSLSRIVGPTNHFKIAGTASGACSRTYRELYTIEGNAFGKICMFPFLYKDRWFGDCTTFDSSIKRAWCAVSTKYENEQWGYCPSTSTEHWKKNIVTGAYYQLNPQSVLTWPQADVSCKQQGASLLSIYDPNEQSLVSALLGSGKYKLWIGLVLSPDHGWQWSNGSPFRYLRWNTGHPLPNPGHNCGLLDMSGLHTWQSSTCSKKMGYVCYKEGTAPPPVHIEQGFCSNPWIPYNGHCFHLHRNALTWINAQKECRKEGGELVSIGTLEDQSFVIAQLGYASTDELWIGLNDRQIEGLFEWSDRAVTVSFTSWEYGKPSTSTNEEDCVLIRGENGNWADRSCDEEHGFICMKASGSESHGDEIKLDLGCKAGWRRHGSYCYFVAKETKTFDEAKEDCKTMESYLADVANGVDNAFLISLVGLRSEKYFWLGLSNMKNPEEFVWTNTDLVRFTHWNHEMPGNRQGCVAMTTGVFAGLWDLLPCTNKEKFICKHQAEGAVITRPPPTATPPKCPEGWIRLGTRNICTKFFTGQRSEEKTWFEARDYCRAIGGDLLSIHSNAELLVGGYGKAWIGLHVADPSTGYVWSDGSPVNFQHWQQGEPNNFNNAESCTEFRISLYSSNQGGSWNDVHCESYNDWLCQIRIGLTPRLPPNDTAKEFNTTADGWLEWRGNQYFINMRSMAMEDARYFCQQRHGDLLTINSEAENNFVWKQISRGYSTHYIGLSVDIDGSFWWMDGSSVAFQRWDQNQPDPNSFDSNCAVMTHYMGFWSTCNCGQEYQSICKRRSSKAVNTTAAPTAPPQGGCPPGWTQFDLKCYSIKDNRKMTWEDARKECIAVGGNLVSIPSRRVQVFLTTKIGLVETTDLWIGLNSIKQDEYFWTDGRKREYTWWSYSKQRRRQGSFYQRWNEGNCVAMTSNHLLGLGKWVTKACNNTNGYICHKNVDQRYPPQQEQEIPDIYNHLGNDSIKVVRQNLTWSDAQMQCEHDKANLASIKNELTQAYVELLSMRLNTPLWIGLNKEKTGGYFKYIDGWHMKSVNWAEGEPSRDRPCVYMLGNGKWKTALCNRTMSSVCMMSLDLPPTESSIYPGVCPEEITVEYQNTFSWIPFKGSCYMFVTDEIEWADAASSCMRHGGSLASIGDPDEQVFIASNVELFKDSHSSFWVGLYKSHKGTWKWLDNTVMDYTNWGPEDSDHRDFGEVRTYDGQWESGRRWNDRAYICETAKLLVEDVSKNKIPDYVVPGSRAHTSLIVILVIGITVGLVGAGFYLYKRHPRSFPTFDNPLYFGSERSQPDVVDTNKLIEKAEEESPEPIITL